MPRKRRRIPKYRHNKTTDRACVEIDGRVYWLGRFDSPESREKYQRLIGQWLTTGRPPEDSAKTSGGGGGGVTVDEVIAAFWLHAKAYYRKPDGTPTSEVKTYRQALKPLRRLYGSQPAADFDPLALKSVRQAMIDQGWCRTYTNGQVNRLKHVFKWAVGEAMVPPAVHQALTCVEGLKLGRCDVRETELVEPVALERVAAIQPRVSRQVWALIELQLLTGARGDELFRIRPIDLETSDDVWTIRPRQHKTTHHGRSRTIYLGPRAQAVIESFLINRPVDAYLFSPREAEAERHARAGSHRRPDQPPLPPATGRRVGQHYTRDSYRRAIARGCDQAFAHPDETLRPRIQPNGKRESLRTFRGRLSTKQRESLKRWQKAQRWHPHQLRHTAATEIRKAYGLEAAQIILGHAKVNTTELYAERDSDKARQIMRKIG